MDKPSEGLTFKEKYKLCKTWQDKAVIISLYHTIMVFKYPTWTITDTSEHFGVSIGLVSENIKLAKEIDKGNKKLAECKSREDALKHLIKRHYVRE
jgi:hypothetical protein